MPEMDVIRQIAEKAIKNQSPAAGSDNWLWDRTLRIVRNVQMICRLPELADNNLPIDRFCLTAATYFADSGFTRCAASESDISRPVLSDIKLAVLRDFSAQVASVELQGILAKPKIETCCNIILESANRFTEIVEAAILSDARNLDDMGIVGLHHEFRRAAIHGKGIATILDNWKRKIDYRYWQARLREGFRFESVRQLAEKRLNTAVWIMDQLSIEHHTQDFQQPGAEMSYQSEMEPLTVQHNEP